MPTPLENKVVVIAGAHTPIGKVLLHQFSETGATIVAIYETLDQAYELFPSDVEGWVLAADLTDENSVEACFQKIKVQFETVYALVFAVQAWDRKPIERTTLEMWQHIMRSNLDACFLVFREAIKLMPTFSGRLIALTHSQAADKARSQNAALAASGAGVIRLVESIAAEYAKLDICAFAVPTCIVLLDEDAKHGVHALDIANLCIQLCAPESRALNGATIRAYGTVQN